MSGASKDQFDDTEHYFNWLFTHAIQYGMTYDDFWLNNDPTLFWAYHTSFINRVKFDFECQNQMAWLSGVYNLRAFQCVMASEKDNVVYFDKPIELDLDKIDGKVKEEIKEEKPVMSDLEIRMKVLVSNTRKKIREKNVSGK